MNRAGKWALGAALTAAAGFAAIQSVSAPQTEVVTATPEITLNETELSQNLPCGYQWAYQDLPELTGLFNESITALDAQASGKAQAFGENCVRRDGTSTFGAMETDFYVRQPVESLTDEEGFGTWISQVMEIVVQIPREDLAGPNYGFVEFVFEKTESERVVLRVPIQIYIDEGKSLSGAELFKKFYSTP